MADELTAELIPDIVAAPVSVPGAPTDPAPPNTGNGTVTGVAGKAGAPAETITLSCTVAALNGGTFSVVGSVSGALGNATVGVAFVSAVIDFTINDGAVDFIVGDNFQIIVVAGGKFKALWIGNPNRQALERASQWTIYSVAAAVVINISPNDDGTGMVASGLVTTANVTRIPDPPACRAVELVGVAAATPAPARFLVRHGI